MRERLQEFWHDFSKPADPAETAARLLAEGKIVGWFQGRSEYGLRALGNRSIIADPREARMKDEINARVKFREEFRPFARTGMDALFLGRFLVEKPRRPRT